MKHPWLILVIVGFLGCQQHDKEEEAHPVDFEKMVIIQDEETNSTISGEDDKDYKVR